MPQWGSFLAAATKRKRETKTAIFGNLLPDGGDPAPLRENASLRSTQLEKSSECRAFYGFVLQSGRPSNPNTATTPADGGTAFPSDVMFSGASHGQD